MNSFVLFKLDPALSPRGDGNRPAWRLPAPSVRPGVGSDLPFGEERSLRVTRGR